MLASVLNSERAISPSPFCNRREGMKGRVNIITGSLKISFSCEPEKSIIPQDFKLES
jgi:hypothetical protein